MKLLSINSAKFLDDRDGEVLQVKSRVWTLPGGKVDATDDCITATLDREMEEELPGCKYFVTSRFLIHVKAWNELVMLYNGTILTNEALDIGHEIVDVKRSTHIENATWRRIIETVRMLEHSTFESIENEVCICQKL